MIYNNKSLVDIGLVKEKPVVFVDEPLLRLFLRHHLALADAALRVLALGDTHALLLKHNVKVHPVNTCAWVVLDPKIDVLHDTEPEVSGVGEIASAKFKLFDLKSLLQNIESLLSADGDMASDLLVTTNGEGANGQPGLRELWPLVGEIGKHLSCAGELIARLTDTDVKGQLTNTNVSHRVLGFSSLNHLFVQALA
jgi:hypothetical protein